MSSHSDAVTRLVLEFPGTRRAGASRPSAARSHEPSGVSSAFAALASYMELLATHCISATRPLRVGWSQVVVRQAIGQTQDQAPSQMRRVLVNQLEDLVELKVWRCGRRAKTA